MNRYARLAYGAFGRLAERRATPALQRSLFQAHRSQRAAAYLASLYLTALLAALGGLAVGAALVLALRAPTIVALLVPGVLAAWIAIATIALAPLILQNSAKERAKQIDNNLPAGLNYLLALANAGVTPAQMWGSLARADAFGALSFEAERIHRDLTLFSQDLLQALRSAQERTPSASFQDFLQGAISAFQAGVELEIYLKAKCSQFQHETQERQKKVIDTMGVLAEAFLVVVVAAPLFLLILLTVMSINQGGKVIGYGMMLALGFIPLCQIVIGAMIRSMDPEGAA